MHGIIHMKQAMGDQEYIRDLATEASDLSLNLNQIKDILAPDAYRTWFLSNLHAQNWTATVKAKLASELAAHEEQEQDAERFVQANSIPDPNKEVYKYLYLIGYYETTQYPGDFAAARLAAIIAQAKQKGTLR